MNMSYSDKYTRVSKRRARKLYDEGKTIRLLPVKVYAENNMFAHEINKNDEFDPVPFDWELFFDTRVDTFEYYNCQYNETGKYAAFYIRREA